MASIKEELTAELVVVESSRDSPRQNEPILAEESSNAQQETKSEAGLKRMAPCWVAFFAPPNNLPFSYENHNVLIMLNSAFFVLILCRFNLGQSLSKLKVGQNLNLFFMATCRP